MKLNVRSCLIGAGIVGALALALCVAVVATFSWLVYHSIVTPPDAVPALSFTVAPDGATIVFSAMDGNLYKLRLGSDRATQIAHGGVLGSPSFSPDGKTLVYAAAGSTDEGCHLWLLDMEGGTSRQVTFGRGVYDIGASISPDGSQVAFIRSQLPAWDEQDLYVLDVRTGAVTQVTHNRYPGVQQPRFTPDGSGLVFSADSVAKSSGGSVHTSLFEVEIGSAAPPRALGPDEPVGLQIGGWAAEPNLLPRGEAMVFVSDRRSPYHYELFLSASDGTNAVPLGTSMFHSYVTQPTPSPDGKSIFYLAATSWTDRKEPIFSLWEVTTDGKSHHERVPSGMLQRPQQ